MTILHFKERPAEDRQGVLARAYRRLILALVSVVALLAIVGCGSAQATVQLGVNTQAGATNEYRLWTKQNLSEVRSFERLTKTHSAFVGLWVNYPTEQVRLTQLQAINAHHSIPEITWEPWGPRPHVLTTTNKAVAAYCSACVLGSTATAPIPVLGNTIHNKYDAYIRTFARTIRRYRHTVYLRFGQEMNGSWFPWGTRNSASTYVGAWRHIHDIFRSQHATNVKWVWAPLANCCLSLDRYPGAAFVDVIGFTGLNGGFSLPWGGWRPFSQIYNNSIKTALPLGKPFQISETATAPGRGSVSRAQWVRGMFADLKHFPQVKSVVWFNVDLRKQRQIDWRVGPDMTSAFAHH